MVAYELYWRDERGKEHFIGILPEKRKNPGGINEKSITNWGRKVIGDNEEVKEIFFTQVDMDELQIESRLTTPLFQNPEESPKSELCNQRRYE
jgi:hypothetical protein